MARDYSREARKSRVELRSEIIRNGPEIVLRVPVTIAEALEASQERAQELSREIGLRLMQTLIEAEVE